MEQIRRRAPLHAIEPRLRHTRLHCENRLRCLRRVLFRLSGQAEHVLDVRRVLRLQVERARVDFQVIRLIGQREAHLIDVRQHARRVGRVGPRAELEERRDTDAM